MYKVEYTDLFGGEANYAWVRRAVIDTPEEASIALIVRRAKKAIGISGLPGRTFANGRYPDFIEVRFAQTVMFITWGE